MSSRALTADAFIVAFCAIVALFAFLQHRAARAQAARRQRKRDGRVALARAAEQDRVARRLHMRDMASLHPDRAVVLTPEERCALLGIHAASLVTSVQEPVYPKARQQ